MRRTDKSRIKENSYLPCFHYFWFARWYAKHDCTCNAYVTREISAGYNGIGRRRRRRWRRHGNQGLNQEWPWMRGTYIRPPVARYCFCLIVKQDGWKINCKAECVFRFVRLNGTWDGGRGREMGKAEEKAERTGWPHTGIQLPRRKTRILYHARATASDFQWISSDCTWSVGRVSYTNVVERPIASRFYPFTLVSSFLLSSLILSFDFFFLFFLSWFNNVIDIYFGNVTVKEQCKTYLKIKN